MRASDELRLFIGQAISPVTARSLAEDAIGKAAFGEENEWDSDLKISVQTILLKHNVQQPKCNGPRGQLASRNLTEGYTSI